MSGLTIFFWIFFSYALLVAFVSWYMIGLDHRQHWRRRAGTIKSRMIALVFGAGGQIQRSSGFAWFCFVRISGTTSSFLRDQKPHLMIAGAVLLVPVCAVMLFKSETDLHGYDDSLPTDPVVLALLQGEQLRPPPALPPEIFLTREVASVRQGLEGASREWMILDPDLRQRLLTVFTLMAQKGYPMALIEGYRSPQRQNYLASLGAHVTNAKAFQSFHQHGLAADCAFIRNGKLVISEKDPWAMQGYRLYGELAESVGLTWGGRWKMMDLGHVEFRGAITARKH